MPDRDDRFRRAETPEDVQNQLERDAQARREYADRLRSFDSSRSHGGHR